MGNYPKITNAILDKVISLREYGLSWDQIHKRVHFSTARLQRLIRDRKKLKKV